MKNGDYKPQAPFVLAMYYLAGLQEDFPPFPLTLVSSFLPVPNKIHSINISKDLAAYTITPGVKFAYFSTFEKQSSSTFYQTIFSGLINYFCS